MKIRFFNARLLTLNGGTDIIDGELRTDGEKITYVGVSKPCEERFDREIDVRGNVLMPTFKNAHTHSAMTFLRSYADDLPLQSWLFDKVFPMEAKLNAERIYCLSRLAVLEYLTSGIGANFDMYMQREAIASASRDMGFRTVMCGAMNDFGGTVAETSDEYDKYNSFDPLISYKVGFHAEYTTKRTLLEELSEMSNARRLPVYTHNSETQNEVDGCMERYGKTPTDFLDSLGMFNYGGGGFHCVWMSDRDIEIFREKKLWAVTNPSSNLKLASGIAPVQKMLDGGVGLAIGTDGPASNNCLDMFREMFLVTALQKCSLGDAVACRPSEVLKMAASGGARAMGLDGCDMLAEGKQADLIILDLMQPNMQPVNNIVKNIVYSGSKSNVFLTMVAGKILYENGEFFVGESAEKIYEKANSILDEIKNEN